MNTPSHPSPREGASSSRRAPSAADRPFVVMNMALTADGKIASADGTLSSFGSRHDQEHLFELRSTADAILCGATTAAADDITLGPGPLKFRRKRRARGLEEYPLRVIASGRARLNPQSHVLAHTFSPILVLTTHQAPASRRDRLAGAGAEVAVFGERELDLANALIWLRRQWKVRRLVCEGGGQLNDAMFRAGLVDEAHLTLCPRIIGGRTAPTISEGQGFESLARAQTLRLRSRRRVGDELFLVYAVS